jgi:type III restriction enzyme
MISLAEFQREKVEELTNSLVRLWRMEKAQKPILLKAPTGSGKTVMLAHFVRGLNHLPTWSDDKAFVWITFSEELAMQSLEKFELYFGTSQENGLLTVADLGQGKLNTNDILFLNWQKLVSRSAENRRLRRPDNEQLRREQGSYFEDFIDATKMDGREIILIIDEAHTNVTVDLAQDMIDYISPRVVIHVTATPKAELVAKAVDDGAYISVDRERVVQEGLIKEKILIQTAEDLERHRGEDFDFAMLDLGLSKRNSLKEQYEKLGKAINPLLLIQLPNDDAGLVAQGEKTKEQVVTDYLEKVGVLPERIGRWFDSHPKPDFIEENDDEHEVLIFKLAAGTGWDCPRAQVLVMFRNVTVEQRYVQTVGRILRNPDPQNIADYAAHPDLRSGYLYTNYHRADIVSNWIDPKQHTPFVYYTHRRIQDPKLGIPSDFLSRADYGDLGSSSRFQRSLFESLDRYFGLGSESMIDARQQKLIDAGIDLDVNVTNSIVVDAQFSDFDQLSLEFQTSGSEQLVELSRNDVEKTFNLMCWNLLREQTEEDAKVSNISRSWSPLKSAFRVWLRNTVSAESDHYYRVVIADLTKGSRSKFRPAITIALKEYRPILDQLIADRSARERVQQTFEFNIRSEYNYPADYEQIQVSKCALESLFVLEGGYPGRANELEFVDYLESQDDNLEWWFKQGTGRDYFGVQYRNTASDRESVFYPDWILRLANGRIGIVDTKSGNTATDTEGRAGALARKLLELGDSYFGGIVLKENGVWYLNQSVDYAYTPGSLNQDWVPLETILNQ